MIADNISPIAENCRPATGMGVAPWKLASTRYSVLPLFFPQLFRLQIKKKQKSEKSVDR